MPVHPFHFTGQPRKSDQQYQRPVEKPDRNIPDQYCSGAFPLLRFCHFYPFISNRNRMNSDAAIVTAPIAASVSILSADGTSQVATTVISERNGWITLAAEGFTFSSPTLKVKFSQAVEPVVTPSPSATPTPAAKPVVKKITITCVKGKTSKKVTAIKPTCPTGYKKK